MKEMFKKMQSLLLFDLPLQSESNSDRFIEIHSYNKERKPSWSTTATTHIMITEYWYESVTKHFGMLLMLAIPLSIAIKHNFPISFAGYLFGALTSFSILLICFYRFFYLSYYLPDLATIREAFDKNIQDLLHKCRQAQLPNFTLVIIYYVMAQCLKFQLPESIDSLAKLLTTVFGIDEGSIRKSLEILLLKSKRKNLSDRRKTEFRNRFEEACGFFEQARFKQGVNKVQLLEVDFFSSIQVQRACV